MISPLLKTENLKTYFFTNDGVVRAVDGLSFEVEKGKTLGLVGESGCGKSVTALSILRLVPSPAGRIISGRILFNGTNLLNLSNEEMRKIRGGKISMIFQEPMTSLNPVFTIGNQIAEAIRTHQNLNRSDVRMKTIEMLELVGISEPSKRINDYPHQLSGGMRQRAMIAMALSSNPELLIADEPTTALDVTIQAQILELLKKLQQEFHMSIILITHDLGIIADTADDVLIMYAGKAVEYCQVKTIFDNPLHPYTIGLLNSIPKLEENSSSPKARLKTIPGIVPDLLISSKECSFADRCAIVEDKCKREKPELIEVEKGHWVRCLK